MATTKAQVEIFYRPIYMHENQGRSQKIFLLSCSWMNVNSEFEELLDHIVSHLTMPLSRIWEAVIKTKKKKQIKWLARQTRMNDFSSQAKFKFLINFISATNNLTYFLIFLFHYLFHFILPAHNTRGLLLLYIL